MTYLPKAALEWFKLRSHAVAWVAVEGHMEGAKLQSVVQDIRRDGWVPRFTKP